MLDAFQLHYYNSFHSILFSRQYTAWFLKNFVVFHLLKKNKKSGLLSSDALNCMAASDGTNRRHNRIALIFNPLLV